MQSARNGEDRCGSRARYICAEPVKSTRAIEFWNKCDRREKGGHTAFLRSASCARKEGGFHLYCDIYSRRKEAAAAGPPRSRRKREKADADGRARRSVFAVDSFEILYNVHEWVPRVKTRARENIVLLGHAGVIKIEGGYIARITLLIPPRPRFLRRENSPTFDVSDGREEPRGRRIDVKVKK